MDKMIHNRTLTAEITLPSGEAVKLYSIAFLADALGRTTRCIRKWEISGILPPTPFRYSNTYWRLYTQEQIDIIVRLAEKYKLKDGISFRKTNFSSSCFKAFEKLEKKYLGE